jgi:hypothetical protein
VRFVVGDVALGLLRTLPFSPVSIITSMLRTLLYLHVAANRKGRQAKYGGPSKKFCFVTQEELDRKVFKIFYGLESLNDATGSDSAEMSNKMWVIYLFLVRLGQ